MGKNLTLLGAGNAGSVNYSLVFDGTGDFISIPDDPLNLSVFTFAVWIYVDAAKENTIKGDTKSSGQRAPKFKVRTDRKLELDEQGVAAIGTSTGTVPLTTWTHVAVTYDVSGNYVFYINGAASGTGTNLRAFSYGDMRIGTSPDPGEDFGGKMDDFRMYSTALSGGDIANIYAHVEPVAIPIAWYKFDEGTGTTALDSSGNGYNGTITNATYSTDVPS